MKRGRLGCLAGCATAVLVPLIALLVLIMIPVWRDNARLDALSEQVFGYPLPPDTGHYYYDEDVTFEKSLVGGSGDFCDYRIRLTLQTALSVEQLRSYYAKATIKGAERKARISLWVQDPPDGGAGNRVIVEVYDSHGSDWDWRCT